MVLFLALCTVGVAVLLMPDAFVGVGQGMIDNPAWGMSFVTVLALVLVWNYYR